MTAKPIEIATYRNTDADCAPDARYLALVIAKGVCLSCHGKTKKEAHERATNWLADERAKVAPKTPAATRKGTVAGGKKP